MNSVRNTSKSCSGLKIHHTGNAFYHTSVPFLPRFNAHNPVCIPVPGHYGLIPPNAVQVISMTIHTIHHPPPNLMEYIYKVFSHFIFQLESEM